MFKFINSQVEAVAGSRLKTSIKMIYIFLFLISLFSSPVHADSPSELIGRFYNCRKFMHGYAMEIVAGNDFSSSGRKLTDNILLDYTVIEITTDSAANAYAEVEVKLRSVGEGIRSHVEFWKMYRHDGIWIIENIYTPNEWQIRKVCRSNSPLCERVEALASFRYQYEVEDVPSGTPIQKCVAYINRYDYLEAFYWADVAVRKERTAGAYFWRGLLHYALGRIDSANRDLNIAIRADGRYYFVLMKILADSEEQSGESHAIEKRSHSVEGRIQSMF